MPGPEDIAAAVLSAGESRRMGSPKALLDAGDGDTFVERIVKTLRAVGVRRILVVVAPDAGPIRLAVERVNASLIVNPDPAMGPISSIRAALDVVDPEGFGGLMFWPVDMPLVKSDSVRRVLDAYDPDGPALVVPTFEGRRGHPVIHGRAVWPELRSPEADAGARVLARKDPARVLEVPVADEGVLLDIDTKREYRRHRARWGSRD